MNTFHTANARRAAVAGLLGLVVLGAPGVASAETYRVTGDLVHLAYFDHGATGQFDLLVETAGPLTAGGVAATAIQGTYFGRTVTGLVPYYGTANLLNSLTGVDFDGLAFSFAPPLAGSYWTGQNDSIADIWFSSRSQAYYSYLSYPGELSDYSSSYEVRNFSLTLQPAQSQVPEPAGYGLSALALAALGLATRQGRARRPRGEDARNGGPTIGPCGPRPW